MFTLRIWAPLLVLSFAPALLTTRAQTPTIGKRPVLPANNVWNTPIDPPAGTSSQSGAMANSLNFSVL
jgi:hypothetical protein